MKKFFTYILLVIPFLVNAQFDQISVGPSYSLQAYYDLESGESTFTTYNSWDIAFSTQGFQDAGIFINEGLPLSMTGDIPAIELYLTPVVDFSEEIVLDTSQWTRVYNQEVNWQQGAFNELSNPMNPLDFGWGTYNPGTMTVEGTKVYVILLRNGSAKKIKINSLSLAYEFVYADLDGSNEVIVSIAKSDHAGKVLAYYSIQNNVMIDVEPANWDLQFARYGTLADNGMGVFLENYEVTGVLSGLGVKVAIADGVDPATVDSTMYSDLYESRIDVVGHDWKFFDLGAFQWNIDDDRAYFVKTADESVCKVVFIDFEGSATGVTTIEKDCSNVVSSTAQIEKGILSTNIFPNPSNGNIDLVVELEKSKKGKILLFNLYGQKVFEQSINLSAGFTKQALHIPLEDGMYQFAIQLDNEVITHSIVIEN